MYQPLQKICRDKVRRVNFFRANLGKFGQNILCTSKNCLLLHQCAKVYLLIVEQRHPTCIKR